MSLTKEDILDAISKMSIMDVCELVKMMEKKFNISATKDDVTTPVAIKKDTIAEEKAEFDLVLIDSGPNKISTIKLVRAVTGLGLKEAKAAVENTPFIVKKASSKEEAEDLKKQLEESGAKAELK